MAMLKILKENKFYPSKLLGIILKNLFGLLPIIIFTIINFYLVKDSFIQKDGTNLWVDNKLWDFKIIFYQFYLTIIITSFLPRESSAYFSLYIFNYLFKLVFYLSIGLILILLCFSLGKDFKDRISTIWFGPMYLYLVFAPLYFYLIPVHLLIVYFFIINNYRNNKRLAIIAIIFLINLIYSFIPWYKQLNLFLWEYHSGLII